MPAPGFAPDLAGAGDADQDVTGLLWNRGEPGGEVVARLLEILADESEAMSLLRVVDIRRDHRNAGAHGAVDRFVEDLAARESHDDAIGLLRDRRLEVVELFLKAAVLLQEYHLAVGLDLAASLVHAFLHGLPEDVGRVRMVEIGVPLLCPSGRGTENQPADGPRGKQPSLAHHHWPP